jgi:hypothetical protein
LQIHIVNFTPEGKIQNIRQHWDQGSLLRSVEVIGARGRNWPLRDGKDQVKLIQSTASFEPGSEAASRRGTVSSENSRPTTSSSNSSKNAMRDPHASLSLFEPAAEQETIPHHTRPLGPSKKVAKPPPRDLGELFVGDETAPETPQTTKTAARGGTASKGYHPIRLFDGATDAATPPKSPERSAIKVNPASYEHFEFGHGEDAPTPTAEVPASSVKTHTKKYSHFEFGNGEEASAPVVPEVAMARSAKHNSQWSFEDFTTPSKPGGKKVTKQDTRNFSWSDDEVSH